MEESKEGGVVPAGGGADTITEQQVIGAYRGMLGDVNQMRRKISELEQEVSEHQSTLDNFALVMAVKKSRSAVRSILPSIRHQEMVDSHLVVSCDKLVAEHFSQGSCTPFLYRMVVDTLTPLEVTRRAYRLVGGVLVERTVGEVLPTVKANQEGIKQLLLQLAASKTDKEKAAAEWKIKYKIRSQQEAQAMSQAQGGQPQLGAPQASPA